MGTQPFQDGCPGMNRIQKKVADWLIRGDIGLSSKTMAAWLAFGTIFEGGHHYSHDPDDFDRCLRLLEAVPELRPLLPKMAALSPIWEALIKHWDEIERSHLDEVGLHWTKARSAPRTYALMRKIIDSVRVAC